MSGDFSTEELEVTKDGGEVFVRVVSPNEFGGTHLSHNEAVAFATWVIDEIVGANE